MTRLNTGAPRTPPYRPTFGLKIETATTSCGSSMAKPSSSGATAIQVRIGDKTLDGFDAKALSGALIEAGYPAKADPARLDWGRSLLVLWYLVLLVTMVYGPIAAWLVELFPTRIRYTSMSLPYHIGNGWFGGFLPTTSFAMVAATGDIYYGLWYPVVVAAMTFVLGLLFLPETYKRPLDFDDR